MNTAWRLTFAFAAMMPLPILAQADTVTLKCNYIRDGRSKTEESIVKIDKISGELWKWDEGNQHFSKLCPFEFSNGSSKCILSEGRFGYQQIGISELFYEELISRIDGKYELTRTGGGLDYLKATGSCEPSVEPKPKTTIF